MPNSRIIGTVKNITSTGLAREGTRLTVKRSQINGAHSTAPIDFYVGPDGVLQASDRTSPAEIEQGAYILFEGAVKGFDKGTKWVQIPESSTVDINDLADNANAAPAPPTAIATSTYNAKVAELEAKDVDLQTQIDSFSGGGQWGEITGTLSDQTDVSTVLASKASTAALTAETSARAAGDASTLSTANDYTDTQVASEASARASADALKAPLASPALTGTPTAPTPSTSTNSTQLATTAFVQSRIGEVIGTAPANLDTLQEIAAQLANDESAAAALTTTVAGKEPVIAPGTTGQYWRGDKSWQALDKSAVGLGSVTNDAQAKADFSGYASKTTPADADTAIINDSAASGATKKLTWANIKSTLKAYFDTIYQAAASALTNSAGSNVLPKSNGTNLVASRITDDGTDIAIDSQGGTFSAGDLNNVENGTKVFIDVAGGEVAVTGMLTVNTDVVATTAELALKADASVVAALASDVAGKQASDSDLDAVAGLSTTGLIARIGTGSASTRTLTAGSTKVSVTNGSGVSGNPTVDVVEANISRNALGGGALTAANGGFGSDVSAQSGVPLFATGTPTFTSTTGTGNFVRTTSPTIVTPTIASFANANHDHTNSAGGGQLAEGALNLSDVTTNNASSSKHGFLPKLSNSVYDNLRGDGTYARGAQVLFLYASGTGTGNSGTGETDLQSYTLPASVLASGKVLRITVEAATANNANSKALRVYFGATVIATPQNGTTGNGMTGTYGVVAGTGATSQIAIVRNYLTSGGNESGNGHVTTTPAETLSGTIVIKVTGQSNTASNDVLLKFFMIELLN